MNAGREKWKAAKKGFDSAVGGLYSAILHSVGLLICDEQDYFPGASDYH
jgi:hypothetical protein